MYHSEVDTQDSGTVHSVAVKILADGLEVAEYQPTINGKDMVCWVPLETGQIISVQCDLQMPQGGCHVDLLIDGVIRNTGVSSRKSFGRKFILNQAYFRGQRALLSGKMKVAEVHPGKYMMRQDKTIAIVINCFDSGSYRREVQ